MFMKIAGNLCFCGIFVVSAYSHITQWNKSVSKIEATPLPNGYGEFFLGISVLLLILGSLSIVLDIKPSFGHTCYLLFLIPVTWFMHTQPCLLAKQKTYVLQSGTPEFEQQSALFAQHFIHSLKNLALIGACLRAIAVENGYYNQSLYTNGAFEINHAQKKDD